MPTYQYRCTSCGRDLEVVQKFSDPTLTVCPTCQGALRKVFNAVGVVFKGSGFYRTDSRSGDAKGGSADSGDKSDKGDKKESGTSAPKADAPSGGSKDGKSSDGGSAGSGSATGSTSGSGTSKATSGSSTGGSGSAG